MTRDWAGSRISLAGDIHLALPRLAIIDISSIILGPLQSGAVPDRAFSRRACCAS